MFLCVLTRDLCYLPLHVIIATMIRAIKGKCYVIVSSRLFTAILRECKEGGSVVSTRVSYVGDVNCDGRLLIRFLSQASTRFRLQRVKYGNNDRILSVVKEGLEGGSFAARIVSSNVRSRDSANFR